MSHQPDQPMQINRLPWPLTLAALVAFTALGLTSGRWDILILLGILLLVQQLTHRSLPPQLQGRAVRVGLLALITIAIGWPQESIIQWYLKPSWTILIGHLLAAEIVIRAWSPARRSPPVLMLSALVLGCAGNTVDRTNIQLLVPVYTGLLVLALRAQMTGASHHWRFWLMRLSAGMLALLLGLAMMQTLTRLERELQLWTMNLMRRAGRTSDIGLSAVPQLGAVFNPEPSMERVLLLNGPRAERCLRVMSFDTYDDGRWGPSLRMRDFKAVSAADLGSDGPGERLTVRIIGDTFDMLPLPLNCGQIDFAGDLQRDGGSAVRLSNAKDDPIYELIVPTDPRYQGPLCLSMNDEQRKRLLAFPQNLDEKVQELARRVAGEGSPLIRITRLIQHLQANHSYSLLYNPGQGEPLTDFILNNRSAHCQYFASALVIMSRATGIPARLVTGYYAHEPAGTDRMVVRDRDAHAWAECWIDGIGWITMDATPATGLPDVLFSPPSRWRTIWENIIDFPTLLRQWLGFLSQRMVLWVAFCSAVAVIAIGIVQMLRRKRATDDMPYSQPDAVLAGMARRFEKWLSTRGPACPANRTWREHAAILPYPAESRDFIESYDIARFGRGHPNDIAAVAQALQKLHESAQS